MAEKTGETVLELKRVSFSYGKAPTVDGATLSVKKGDFVGMIGPNGAGKTTFVKLVLGLLKPTHGVIKLFGKEITGFREWHRIGYVPQKATNFDQNFPATVFEVASMGRFAKAGMGKHLSKDDYAAVERALGVVGMTKLRDRRIGELSGGQEQRVFIARALAAEPELLILDEPTAGVDAEAQHEFYSLLKRLNEKFGLTLILVSHDIGMVSKTVNKLVCVNIAVTMHDVSKGINEADLHCAYPGGMELVPHHHA